MTLEEAVAEWREKQCAQACPTCPMNCCEGRLNPRLDTLEAFSDVPVVRNPLDPRPAEGPYVVEKRTLWWGTCHLVGRCPRLTDEKRCSIYGEASRPKECREYPLHLQKVVGRTILSAEQSCWIFQQEENRRAVRALAEELGVEIAFHPA